ncbi:uncharacterized protein PAC_12654 [Phialocephala subalpina]|uniref:Uncharacterized protein n=1 Tax=Phialocephala subalpina TaxID=576137 RepID=A0A1L7XCR6_9HELO|nr:uncharacterized protein PAC_12654 [Phialocephala subalpina]
MEKIKSALFGRNLSKLHIFQSRQTKHASSVEGNQRYDVCKLLADHRVPNVIWLEDLLALHGSDTQVWDLHLLVEDPATAAKILLGNGYQVTPPEAKFANDPEFSKRAIRLTHDQFLANVILHSARDWYYELGGHVQDFLPPLHSFLDSLIEFWLNISSQDYVDRLGFALYISCLINYCYAIQSAEGELVKNPTYAKKLKPEHREVHYNITSSDPKEESFTTTNRHIYHARRSREIREGIFIPTPYGKGVFKLPLTAVPE